MFIKKIGKKIQSIIYWELILRLESIELKSESNNLRIQRLQEALGRIEARQLNHSSPLFASINDYEFRVFSQSGEDGIIQFLIKNIQIQNKVFVEFGVEDYTESNTRFLLINNNWTGLVIDGSESNVLKIKKDRVYWLYNLKACHSFVTRENINTLLENNGISGEIGLLSIDVDGNDYWIWESIKSVNPIIVVIEYNHRFGCEDAVSIPYDPGFDRFNAHHSMIYFGASLPALCQLGKRKGYTFVGCCSNGVNAFFIRSDKRPNSIREMTVEEGYFPGNFCELRESDGKITKVSPEEEKDFLRKLDLPLVRF